MKRDHFRYPLLLLAVAAGLAWSSVARADDPHAQSREAITKLAASFSEAFAKGDAKALSEFWTPDGDMIDLTGRVTRGRQAIAEDFASGFKENKGLTVRIEVLSIRFPTPDTAVEDGITTVLTPDNGIPDRARYTNVLVKQDGKWLLSSVREEPFVPPSNAEQLRPLAWLLGEWSAEAKDAHVGLVRFEWSSDQNFILATRAVAVQDVLLDNGSSRIGWDPAAKMIRTWNFESDGGFGEGNWTLAGENKWVSRTSSVLSNGSITTATTTLTRTDPHTITWQATEQRLNGKAMPDSPLVRMTRAGSNAATTRPVTAAAAANH
jgi:uncharacterized protein (TIGR02246 family)